MAINLRKEISYGNIKKIVNTELLPHDVWCPICEQFVDGNVNNLDIYQIEPACGCDMDKHNQELNDANDVIEAREERIDDLEGEVKDLEKEVERLKQELLDAES